ncbi:BsuPI-related putative proteinase inhibitor [Bacillus daqingensis]|uniref:Intracellular proteinase inhibitor BsuPI domain-containing protein n=1 Tax=Bacillus daqingensis TaxID=872396 RepID=A0ABV9NV14_9BACI
MKRTAMLAALLLAATACGTADNEEADSPQSIGNNNNGAEEAPEENEPGNEEAMEGEADMGDLHLQADADEQDGEINVTLTLTNNGDSDAALDFRSGQKYDVKIYDSSGTKVYDYSEDMMFTQALETVELAAGESISYEVRASVNGEGPYQIEAAVTAAEVNGKAMSEGELSTETDA